MRRNGIIGVLAVSMILIGATSAGAQQFKFGPRVAFGLDSDLAVGGMATYGFNTVLFQGAGPLTGSLAFDYFFGCWFDDNGLDDFSCNSFEIAPTVFIPFATSSSGAGPYAGAGLNYWHYSVDYNNNTPFDDIGSGSKVGLALQGGYMFPLAGQTAMADARFTLGGSEQLVLAFAFLFGGSRN